MRLFANHSNEFRQFKNGDQRAMKFFFNRYGRPVYWYLFWKSGDEDTASEMTMDVFPELWKIRDTIANEEQLIGFLFITAYHRCLSRQQGERVRWKAEDLAAISAEEAYLFLDDPDLLKGKILCTMDLALYNLPELQRNVLQKLFIERKSVQTAAREMKVHPQTIRTYHARAVEAMRQQLSELEFLLAAMGLLLLREKQ
jgi:RNA polymerase sigma factor (sigma-70 family)